jgi:hypothetical protein
VSDHELGFHRFELPEPLLRGAETELSFVLHYESRGFRDSNFIDRLAENAVPAPGTCAARRTVGRSHSKCVPNRAKQCPELQARVIESAVACRFRCEATRRRS